MDADIKLNPGQQAGADAFFNFLVTDEKYFCLSGGAGVGKTFTVKYIHQNVVDFYRKECALVGEPVMYDKVEFTATTNKAAEVLENAIGEDTSTIHSYLGLKVKENFKTGTTDIIPTNNFGIKRRTILIIDECSMIDSKLLKYIDEAMQDSKVVFVGDHAQMAPVNEARSPIYDLLKEENIVVLTEAVRNAEQPALMDLCNQLRHTVEEGQFQPIQAMPGVVEYLDDQAMQEKLAECFLEPDGSARILCYTNSRVQDYNAYIREIRDLPEQFTAGDELVVASTYTSGATIINVERQVTLISVDPEIRDFGYQDYTQSGDPLRYREGVIELPLGGRASVKLITRPKELNYVLKALSKTKSWSEYFTLKAHFIDLRDKYACTVYKSQGSTYHTVFIDLGNIGTSYDKEQVARMLFVGASRATTKVYLFGQLPAMYQGRNAA